MRNIAEQQDGISDRDPDGLRLSQLFNSIKNAYCKFSWLILDKIKRKEAEDLDNAACLLYSYRIVRIHINARNKT